MQNDNQKNTVIFFAIALVLLAAYQFLVIQPQAKRQEQARAAAAAQQAAAGPMAGAPGAVAPPVQQTRAQALAGSPRVPVATPSLQGSIALKGARIDDLFLTRYKETLDPKSPPVEMLRPAGAADAFYSDFGWTGANVPGLPDANTLWTAQSGAQLTPQSPLTLTYRSPQGLAFTRVISVDKDYMFTVADTVANTGAAPVSLIPYGSVVRQGVPAVNHNNNAFQGAIGWIGEQKLKTAGYKDWKKKGERKYTATGGWMGITDKYWLAALIPDQHQQIDVRYRVTPTATGEVYDTNFAGHPINIAPGRQVTVTHRLFAGAKTVPILQGYEQSLGVPEFDRAIDWGLLSVITRPIFWLLEQFYHLLGNFGLAILLLTVCVRGAFFWPSNKSYESMTKMKKVQPELEQIRKRNKEDPAKQQQEMMALYAKEKINPIMGCLPVLATIPVFLALYKVLSVTIEMRHAPFFGWIKDLSAPDPSNIWNLFGLIPWDPATAPLIGAFIGGTGLLHLGVWAITYGVTMWMTQSMSPQTGIDPTQAKIMQLFPLVFTFVLAQFAVGLLIYYTWSNILGILQQYVIMRRFKVDNPIDKIIRGLTGKRKPATA